MENLLLSPDEQKLLLKCRKNLERKYNVSIYLPEYIPTCEHDVVVATVRGGKINLVKNFIQKRLDQMNQRHEQRITVRNNVTVITISDSDSDCSVPINTETQQKRKRKQRRRAKKIHAVNKESNELQEMSPTVLVENNEGLTFENSVQNKPEDEASSSTEFLPVNSKMKNTVNLNEIDKRIVTSDGMNVGWPIPSPSFAPMFNAEIVQINGNFRQNNAVDETIILSDSPSPPPELLPLNSGKKEENIPNEIDDSVVIIEDEIPRPKRLRPIVIDGCNVAREHGKISNTFSCKGIKIAIDYFLEKGHPQVTAFVPHYRRHDKFGPIVTTDQHLLEELAKEQYVVFTPSRYINKKRVACYDDRFIVELATKTGGVILSNDNYRDLVGESEEFKKTIHERLLMFCFVRDMLMIPHDPLGRRGPSLENFLSFPAE